MKIIFLFTSILLAGLLTHAQQRIPDVQFMNLQTYVVEFDSLYNGHNYDYYNAIFKKATNLRNAGISLTSAGVCFYVGSFIASGVNLNTTAVLFLLSVATISLGVPLWIAGGVNRKNNRKVMEQIKKNTSISFRVASNGVGLVFSF